MAEEQEKRRKFQVPEKWRNFLLKALVVVGLFLFAFRSTFFGPDVQHMSQLELLDKARQGR